jgi:glyoxylase-like metal-dependent hydrolase (beta-lactamase superfamily II)
VSALYTINSLRVGELYLPHGGGIMRDPVHVWLVRGEGHNILVDSGMAEIELVSARMRIGGSGGGHASLVAGLARQGLTPGDIDTVILTHLHFDHADNLDLFPGARVIVQRAELAAAIDPVPSQRIYYWKSTLEQLIGRKRPAQLRVLDGDTILFSGISLLLLPSHSEGMQIVTVDTEKGRVGLVSDLGDHYRYWFPADPRATTQPQRSLAGDFLTANIRTSGERDWQAAMRRVQQSCDIVVPAHDFRIPKSIPEEWFAIPGSTSGDLAHVSPPTAFQPPSLERIP